jgi:hypothetical protein
MSVLPSLGEAHIFLRLQKNNEYSFDFIQGLSYTINPFFMEMDTNDSGSACTNKFG